jgi:polyphosphate glucokinase
VIVKYFATMNKGEIFMQIMGIDIGGSGIKGALVDIEKGELVTERHRIPTPSPATPDAVTDVVAELVQHFEWNGAIGCTFPAIIKDGVAHSAANVDQAWIGTDAQRLIQRKTGDPVRVLNDADAAGVAEMAFGAGRGKNGVVIMLTVGTGIGSAIFLDGQLVPNSELGHVEIRGKDGEDRASDRIREEKDLSWKKWAKRLDEYLRHIEFLFSPDLFIIGGGVSKKYNKYFPYLKLKTEIVPAQLRNNAGIVGAAMAARNLV